jgi:hypothetical protein
MPAIHPARLKQQTDLVAQHFEQPDALVRSLHHLLDFYADRANRPGQSRGPDPLLTAYHVKAPVLRQVVLELSPLAQADPDTGLAVCQAMWKQPYLEFRLMASSLLGELPAEPAARIVQQVKTWAVRDTDLRILDSLALDGLKRVRKEHPQVLIRSAEAWLLDKEYDAQRLGMRLLLPLVNDPDFPNLPVIFRIIQPYIRQAPRRLRPEILDLLAALARRSPVETASYLRQTLTLPESPDTAWFIRQIAPAFPPEIEERLRSTVRGLGALPGKQ